MLSGPMGNGSPPVPPHAGVTVPWGVTARASRSGSPAGAGFAAPAVTCGGAATHTPLLPSRTWRTLMSATLRPTMAATGRHPGSHRVPATRTVTVPARKMVP